MYILDNTTCLQYTSLTIPHAHNVHPWQHHMLTMYILDNTTCLQCTSLTIPHAYNVHPWQYHMLTMYILDNTTCLLHSSLTIPHAYNAPPWQYHMLTMKILDDATCSQCTSHAYYIYPLCFGDPNDLKTSISYFYKNYYLFLSYNQTIRLANLRVR